MGQPQDRLALVELIDRDGRIGRSVDVHAWPVTLGRALDNQVVLDDPHVAAHHARLGPDAQGVLRLEVGDSVNGALVGARRVAAGQGHALAQGHLITLGGQRLRLRLRGDTLAPERAMGAPAGGRGLVLLLLLLLAMVVAGHWVDLDPGADFTAWLPVALGAPLMLAGWCGAWALASKLFQHRFDFWGHLAIALPWLLVMQLAAVLVPHAAAALGWPWLWQASTPLQAVLAALMLRAHLVQVLPSHGRVLTLAMAALVVVSGSVGLAFNLRSHDRPLAAPYMATLPLPNLRLGSVSTPAALVQAMDALREPLAQRVRQAASDEAQADADETPAD
jgi:hypothetical protein